jgi:hypothetical protein
MPTVLRSGSEEITCDGSMRSPPASIATTRPSRTSSFVTGQLSRTSPPLAMISSAIVSHIWPGPKRG